MAKVKKIFLFVLIFVPICSFSQNNGQKIEGLVVDGRTDEPVIGASVTAVGTSGGAITDFDGHFTLTVKSLPATVKIEFLGYRSQEIDVYEYTEPVRARLVESNFLQEVVVVGYGTQKRKELTGSISSIPKETLAQPVISIANLLGGAVAGVQSSQGGQPGSAATVRIRGGNSITASNDPLYVIDGVILYNGGASTEAGVSRISASLDPLAALNPNDIESIDILKDISATAIYGSRGSNGVIIVTTKNGQRGRGKVDYQYSLGWSQATKTLDLLNASQWAKVVKEVQPTGVFKDYTDADFAALKSYDWQNAALRTGTTGTHQISVSGGDEKTRYLISGNFTDQQGILLNTDFKRYTGRLNLDREVFRNLTVGLNLSATKLNQNGLFGYAENSVNTGGFNSPFTLILRTSPANAIYAADGKYNYANPYELGNLVQNGVTVNAISDLANTTAQNLTNSLLGNFYAQYAIIPGLVAKLSAASNITNSTQNYFAPSYTTGGFLKNSSGYGGYASVGNRRTDLWQYEWTLNYTKQLNDDHYINVLGGYTTQNTQTRYATAAATSFLVEALKYNGLEYGEGYVVPEAGGYDDVLISYLGRVNYTFKHRYNLTASIRNDGSSKFAKNHRWLWAPSVGVSWNVDEEDFLKGNKTVSALILRASYGKVGNSEIDPYRYAELYGSLAPYSFNGVLSKTLARTNLQNDDLKWESTNSFNVGLDVGLFNQRLNLAVDFYNKKTNDLLISVPVEITTGVSSSLQNLGNVGNKGVEIEARGQIINRKNLKWSVGANFGYNQNKVLSLGGEDSFQDTYFVGQPLGTYYLIEFAGIVQEGEDVSKIAPASWQTGWNPAFGAGDEKFVDQNGDGTVDDNDRVLLGSSQPNITYGFSTSLSYKTLTLSVLFQGVEGRKIYNSLAQTLETANAAYNLLATLNDRWTPTNPSNTVPKVRSTATTYSTSRYLENGDFLRLKNITLGYELPFKIQGAPTAKAKVFASGENLLTFTKYTGYDPETGGSVSAYPLSRTFTLGINLSY